PELAELRPQLAGKAVGAVDFGGVGRDLVLGEGAHGVAQHVDVAAEAEIKTGKAVLDHGALHCPLRAGPKVHAINSRSPRACQRGDPAAVWLPERPLAGRTILSIASAGRGLANRKPCISSPPARRSRP